jgi:hypothetical protein
MSDSAAPHHRYFIAWPDVAAGVRELQGVRDESHGVPDARYALAVLAELEPLLSGPARHFYLTKDTHRLPEYGAHVVAILLLEERCKVPEYGRQVGAVLRNMTTRPYLGFRLRSTPGRLEATLIFEYVRDWYLHLRSRATVRDDPPQVVPQPRILRIPLGYQSQRLLSHRTMSERTLDTFFAGDVATPFARNNYRYWIPPSKTVSRRQLWRVLKEMQATGEWRIELDDVRPDEPAAKGRNYLKYSERMMNSRICIAPRGSNAESYRFYEGLRAGCLVLTSPFPDEPFLRDAPAIVVDNWRQLPDLMRRYARDIDTLERYREAGLAWWEKHCSEPVIARHLASILALSPSQVLQEETSPEPAA